MAIKNRNLSTKNALKFYNVYGTYGNTANQTSGSSYSRIIQELLVTRPFLLEAVVWNISTSQTYNLELVNGISASPTILRTLASGVSLTGGNVDNTIPVSPVLLLQPSIYYFSLYCSTPVTQRRNSSNPVFDADGVLGFNYVSYSGSPSRTGTAPIKFVGHLFKYLGFGS